MQARPVIATAYRQPPVAILAGPERSQRLGARLLACGLRPSAETPDPGAETPVPVLVDWRSLDARGCERVRMALRDDPGRPIVLLNADAGCREADRAYLSLADDRDLPRLAQTLAQRRRRSTAADELSLRLRLARALAPTARLDRLDTGRNHVLYAGQPGRLVLDLQAALRARGLPLIAFPDARNLPERLSQPGLVAALIAPREEARWRDPLARLPPVHAPLHVRLEGPPGRSLMASLTRHAASVVAPDREGESLATLLASALGKRRHTVPPPDLAAWGGVEGLWSNAALRHHLPRQLAACAAHESPLSLLCLRLRHGPSAVTPAVGLARCIMGELRAGDLAAQLDEDRLALVLRDTPYGGAVRLAQRLAERVESARLRGPLPCDSVLSWRIVERRAYHTADDLIQSGRAGPYVRPPRLVAALAA